MKTLKLVLAISLTCGFLISCTSLKQHTSLNKDYTLDHVILDVKDNKTEKLLKDNVTKSAFKKGQTINTSIFVKERKRITKLIRKNQNADFSETKISFEIDTTFATKKYSITTIVKK